MGRRLARKPRERTRGERNCDWIELYCRVPEGRFVGQRLKLRPFQREIVIGIYDNPKAITRRAIVSFGKKNAKTSLAACLLLLHLVGPEARPNGQLFSAAQDKAQAAVLFGLASKMVRMDPDLSANVTIRHTFKELYCPDLGTLYKALTAEAKTKHGLSPVFMVHDELGQVSGPRSDLYDALESAAGANDQPLSIVISTQAPEDGDLLSMLIDDAQTGVDPSTVLFLWTAPLELDPFSEEAIKAANPAYGDFLNAVEVRNQAENARRMPAKESSYRNLTLNQRVKTSSPYCSRAVWQDNGGAPDPQVLTSARLFIGLDLSARQDLTALVTIGQDAAGKWNVFPRFYTPEVTLVERSKRDRVPYDVWVKQGHLVATPGSSIDYGFVARDLLEICDSGDVGAIGFDRWRMDVLKKAITDVCEKLERDEPELPLVPFGQGFRDMTPALDELDATLLDSQMLHGMHPVLTSCIANAVIVKDPAGNRKLDKSKATGRIDGAVALAMARGVAITDKSDGGPLFVEL